MKYKAFANYQKGYSHIKSGTACEDYAESYADPHERFFISAVCDGHSDNNCFRSSKGARYGCEAAIEVLKRFFELYYEAGAENVTITDDVGVRLKKAIKQYWDERVSDDIKNHPITEEEKRPLSEHVRSVYESGRGLKNIYGATFLAAGISENLCVALHIGDGIMMFVDKDGTYCEPLKPDEKSEMGSPASLCDTDLFSRENAFRCIFLGKSQIPQAVIVSSDGIGDCMEQLHFMEVFYSLIDQFQRMEQGIGGGKLNESQENYLESLVKHYAEKGHGVEDDCSLAGFYNFEEKIPFVKIPLRMAERLWKDAVQERNEVIEDYEKRKREAKERIDCQTPTSSDSRSKKIAEIKGWMDAKDKTEDLKEVLRTIVKNEENKTIFYDSKLKLCEKYIIRAGGLPPADMGLVKTVQVDPNYLEENVEYKKLKVAYDDFNKKKTQEKETVDKLDAVSISCREAQRRIKMVHDSTERMEAERSARKLEEILKELSNEYEVRKKETDDSWKSLLQQYTRAERSEQETRKSSKKRG